MDEVKETGEQLMSLCGHAERPEVKKNIDDLDMSMGKLEEDCEKRSKTLDNALKKAVHFQDELMVCSALSLSTLRITTVDSSIHCFGSN